jgi:tetratricopeptide (TPR) repeat protein
MKKIQFSKMALLLSLALAISSCAGLKKMQDQANTVKYEATPKVLEMNNGEVAVSITGNYPPKYFNKNAVVTITPVLNYEGGQLDLKPITLQGEAVKANDKAINYAQGGSFNYSDKFAYKDEMMQSQLELKVSAVLKKKTLDIGAVKVADGIIVTPKLVMIDPKSIALGDKFQRTSTEDKTATIQYIINRSDIRPAELKKEDIQKMKDFVKSVAGNPKYNLKGIEIASAASPDGPVKLNTNLASERENSAVKLMKDELKKDKIEQAKKDSFFTFLKTPEDWEGFKEAMEKSDIKDKELVLRVLSMYSDPEVREKEIRNIAQAFEEIKETILPPLRKSKYIVKAETIGYSDEELLKLGDTNPDTLNLEELLYTANLVQDMNKKEALYKKAAGKFPNDVRTNNNLGYVEIQLGKLDEAKTALEAAKAVENNDAVKNNLGVVSILKGDMTAAEELLSSAMGAGEAPSYNLGILNIIKGKYDQAITYFGNACEFNAALAKVLNKNYEAAISTITCSKSEEANAYYLRAVIGARTDNGDMVFNNLRTAVGKDAKLKAYAKKDAEFLKYVNDETFKSIIQ